MKRKSKQILHRLRAARLMRKAARRLNLPLPGNVLYIGGSDTLPPPLNKEQEAAALDALKSGDALAKKTLIEHNLRLVVYISKRFENTGINIEDLISIGTLGLVKAVNTFRSDKNIKLATYASRCIENEILMYFRKVSGKQEVSLDEPLNTDPDGGELLLSDVLGSDDPPMSQAVEEAEERVALRRAVAALEERERLIIRLRFGLDGVKEMTQSEVADLLGISQSYISRLEKKILRKLRTALEGGW